MKQRIKLNNKKLHFPLPLGEGRISTQGTSVRNSGEGKSFTKALSVAALAGLTFFGASANAQEIIENQHKEDTTQSVYGGAISNVEGETINNVDAMFRNNSAVAGTLDDNNNITGGKSVYGGAVYNAGTINGTINGLINNYAIGNTESYGGAVYNTSDGIIENLSGAVTGNHLQVTANSYGGAIANKGTIKGGDITELSGNYLTPHSYGYGGAIYNTSSSFTLNSIGNITDNYVTTNAPAYGGAIYNEKGNLGELNGAIKDNYAISGTYDENGNVTSYSSSVYGGAIYNGSGGFSGGKVTEISGNYAIGRAQACGGAIYNTSSNFKLDEIGDIINNHAYSAASMAYGGAIYNTGNNFGSITGTIKNNYVQAKNAPAYGGAIYNTGVINIDGSSIENNYVESGEAYGGAIYNNRGSITGTISNLSDNYIKSSYNYAYGGAIYNENGVISEILNITNNHAYSSKYMVIGGAIYNVGGKIEIINGIIENNYAQNSASGNYYVLGGAIFNAGTIDTLNVTSLKNNYAYSENYYAYGGAIYNTGAVNGGTISKIYGNYVESGSADAKGGAIYNVSSTFKLDEIGDIIDNHAYSATVPVYGGAIYNKDGNLGKLNGAIKDNYAISGTYDEDGNLVSGAVAYGGAIYNTSGGFTGGKVTEISGNYAKSGNSTVYGGAIYNTSSTFKLDEIGDIVNNNVYSSSLQAYGGAIYNEKGNLGKLNGAIKNNYVLSGKLDENGKVISGTGSVAYGGAIYNTAGGFTGGNVTEISGNYAESGNAPAYGGAIYNISNAFKLDEICDITNNHVYSPYAPALGGAIYNENGILGALNGAIKDNYAISGTYENGNLVSGAYAYGGAIYNANNGIVTGGTITEISGNYVEGNAGAYGGAIYNTTNSFKLDEVGDIKDNYARSNYCSLGGAIYNANGTIDGIVNSSFLNNYAEAKDGTAQGGAIYNTGKIGSLVVNNLTDNYIKAKGAYLYGGAIYNTGTVDSGSINLVKGNYILNTTSGTYNFGGAIYNTGVMNVDISNIIDNKITMSTSDIYAEGKGGAIYNTGTIKSLNGHILYNNIELLENGNSSSGGAGGAIYNSGTVNGGTLGNIIGNYINGSEACRIVGGAIYNYSNKFKIDAINGDIADNHVKGWNGAAGGAIYNYDGAFGDVTGNIYNNYSETVVFSTGSSGGLYSLGGAIYNTGTFGNITGNIYNNHAMDGVGGAGGGAIYNAGTMGNIKGDIAQNYTESNYSGWGPSGTGGAIFNGGTIGDISGNIIGNYTYVHRIEHHYPGGYGINGGAIYNYGKIGDITTNAVNNYIKIEEVYAAARTQGGFLHNSSYGTIKNIKGNFVGNYIDASPKEDANPNWSISYGGAISNEGKIERLDAEHFINNHTVSITKDADGNVIGGGSAMGGALYNKGTINGGKIGEISDNYAEGFIDTFGGAIYNNTENFKLDEIGNIVNNKVHSATTSAQGGAIWNSGGDLGKLNGAIVNNHAKAATYDEDGNITGGNIAIGGAIYNVAGGFTGGKVTEISDNYAEGYYTVLGGAIYNISATFKLDGISGNITNNHVKQAKDIFSTPVAGGAIYNQNGDFGDIVSNKISGNYAVGAQASGGGAIYNNNGTFGNISAKEISNNYVKGVMQLPQNSAGGGAIYNTNGTIKDITADKISNNYVDAFYTQGGGVLLNSGTVGNITANKISNNHAKATGTGPNTNGGAISNSGTVGNILANEIKGNYVQTLAYNSNGGAISNSGTMGDVSANMTGNYVKAEPTTNNPAYASGGALSNTGTMGKVTGTYKDNYVKTENENPNYFQYSFARGGAIYNSGTIDGIVNSSFLSNYTEAKDGTAQGGAVWTSKDLDITANNGTSVFKGNYTKTDGEKDDNAIYVASADAKLNLKQLNNGNMYMYDNIRGEDGYNVNISGDSTGTYYMFNDIYNGNVTMANTTINTVNNKIHTYDFKSLSVNGNTDFVADVDMANQTMDRFTASAYGNHSGKLNVKDMNFISGSDKNKIEIYFAQKGLKDYVTTSKKEFLTPLYKYGIHYDNRDDAGYFVFTRGAGSSNPSDGFNPAVLTSPVATQAGAQASMTNTLYYAFEHGDTFMNFSAMDRFAKINSNTYALAERQGALSTDFNSNLNLDYVHQNKAVWTKPYSSFESIHLKNGPKVDVISYGTLIGFDSNIHKLKHGWANVATAYIGYNGSQVDYSNVDASTNGGLLGLTETFYKGNFWTALTATAGASFAEAHTMYGKDEMTMLMAGIGSKTGYNFEFKEGKFIIQPRLFMSYSFVNTFDYTNSAGVRIDSDPMHTVQINPSVKFIGNIKGGWQPYASVGMVWNLLNETNATADGVKLPEMHTKPYVEYGVGLQRTWADKFSAYGQAMLRHGGRNGVALTFGFRWALGKDKTQKVQNNSKMSGRQEIKRTSKTLSHQNKTATEGNRKVLKQLSPTQKQKLSNTTTIENNIYPQKVHLEHTTHTAMKANVEKL